MQKSTLFLLIHISPVSDMRFPVMVTTGKRWPRLRAKQNAFFHEKTQTRLDDKPALFLVPKAGVEPTWSKDHMILSDIRAV